MRPDLMYVAHKAGMAEDKRSAEAIAKRVYELSKDSEHYLRE